MNTSGKWIIWLIVGIVIGGLLFARTTSLATLLPFGLILLCPLMMVFMMSGMHGNHEGHHDRQGHEHKEK